MRLLHVMQVVALVGLCVFLYLVFTGDARSQTTEIINRYAPIQRCYTELSDIPRNTDGSIKRSAAVRDRYQRLVPCPSTGMSDGPCPEWEAQHVWPLACGGCDAVWNLTWAHKSIKRQGQGVAYCLDCVELPIHCDLNPGRVVVK